MIIERLHLLWGKPQRFKFQRRAGLVAASSLNNLLPMLFAPIISLLVIRQSSTVMWGAFVGVLITIQLGAHIVSWGNQEYLLRAFSRQPAHIAEAWQTSLRTRLVLWLGVAVVIVLLYPQMAGWVVVWLAAIALHQSCAVLITYRRDFILAAVVELAGIAVMVTAVLSWGTAVTPSLLIRLFALVTAAKGGVLLVRFRDVTWARHGRFEFQYFALAFPFFLLGFSGMLNSRMDLYIVNLFLTKGEVGQYQVFSTFLLYLQSLAAFILLPFVKTIYRLQYQTIRRISFALFGLGWLIVPPALLMLSFLLTNLYDIKLSPPFFLFGGLSVLPIFFFLPIIYALYKAERQVTVLKINLLGIALTWPLNWLFLPRWGLVGVVMANAVMSWLVLGIYIWQGKKHLR